MRIRPLVQSFGAILIAAIILQTTGGAIERRAQAPAGRQPKVEIFVTAWCTYCKALEAFLKYRGISYERYDIEEDERGREIYLSLGQGGVPVTRIGREVVSGFDPFSLSKALEEQSRDAPRIQGSV